MIQICGLIKESFDVIVVGGGIGGLCAALASARHGARTALVHDRPVLGGNASSEIRMHICGASCHGQRPNAREGGILEEILLENKARNPEHSYALFDALLWEKASAEPNLTLYLNARMETAQSSQNRIESVLVHQMTNEKRFTLSASVFIDCTGDGLLSAQTGAEVMIGREGQNVFGEPGAVAMSDSVTMGNSVLFEARDMGRLVPFIKPDWAYTYDERDLMGHKEVTSGYWWVETGGTQRNTIDDAEAIRDELLKIVFGIWDHVKNRGDHGAEHLSLSWVGFMPGKRESRRIVGAYVLREQDLLSGRTFDDTIAYGGWHIDTHMPEKFASISAGLQQVEDIAVPVPSLYTIPYRCLYARGIENLMMGGRLISASHRAFASTRVMGTCAVVSQAAGTAAAMAALCGVSPCAVPVRALQQALLHDDCYLPGVENQDEADLARISGVTCSGAMPGGECQQATHGPTRTVDEKRNAWVSAPLGGGEAWIELALPRQAFVRQVRVIFDSSLSDEIMISLSDWAKVRQSPLPPATLVKEYALSFYCEGKLVQQMNIEDNVQRLRVHDLLEAVCCDTVRLTARKTHGSESAAVFEVRVYAL